MNAGTDPYLRSVRYASSTLQQFARIQSFHSFISSFESSESTLSHSNTPSSDLKCLRMLHGVGLMNSSHEERKAAYFVFATFVTCSKKVFTKQSIAFCSER